MTRLVVVRHGNTFEPGETPRRIGSRTDLALTAVGVEQALLLGRHFGANRVRFDRVLAGELERTRRTAELIVGDVPVEVASASFLTEIDHGADEGRPEPDVVARIGEDAIARWDTELIAPDGWEVGAQWRVPAWREFVDRVTEELPNGTILLVTSNGAARFALAALGLKIGENRDGAKLRTGSYGLIEVGDNAEFRLIGWNVRPGETPGDMGLF